MNEKKPAFTKPAKTAHERTYPAVPREAVKVSTETPVATQREATEIETPANQRRISDALWHAHRGQMRVSRFTEAFALAILQNPKVDQFLGRNPLDPGRAGDYANAGAALAHAVWRMAAAYAEAIDTLVKENTDTTIFGMDVAEDIDDTDSRPA